jgi:hypothetical protein
MMGAKRALRVFGTCISERSLPAFMKHLSYLDLSRSSVNTLSSSICKVYNLQVLVLDAYYSLQLLPEGMKYMISLRHLYLDGCISLAGMPADIGHLSNLPTLTTYVVGNDPGRGIKELIYLELGGKLQICDLIKVTNQSDAKEANLESKQNLEQLELCWGTREGTYLQDFFTGLLETTSGSGGLRRCVPPQSPSQRHLVSDPAHGMVDLEAPQRSHLRQHSAFCRYPS